MRRGWLLLCLPALLAAGPATLDPVGELAGRYSSHFRNGDVDGRTYWTDDIVEIVPADARHAYFRVELGFFNGHTCSLAGIATGVGSTLDYRAPVDSDVEGCRMTLSRRGRWLHLDDHAGTCSASCGARGGYAADGMPWSSKRPITYLARLRRSSEYRAAMSEWRATSSVR